MLNYEPTLSLHPPPRAIPAVVVRAHYALPGGLVIVVVVHQRCHRLPPPPSSPSRGWLLLGAACRHRHLRHCRPPPMQPHQRRRPRRFASSFSPPEIPLPPVAVAPSPPSRSPMAPSWTGMQRRHPPSWSDAASAAPARAPLVGIRAHCASAAVTTAAMPRFPLWRPAGDPPLLLGPPPPVGRRRRQHGDVDAQPWQPGATTKTPWRRHAGGLGDVLCCVLQSRYNKNSVFLLRFDVNGSFYLNAEKFSVCRLVQNLTSLPTSCVQVAYKFHTSTTYRRCRKIDNVDTL